MLCDAAVSLRKLRKANCGKQANLSFLIRNIGHPLKVMRQVPSNPLPLRSRYFSEQESASVPSSHGSWHTQSPASKRNRLLMPSLFFLSKEAACGPVPVSGSGQTPPSVRSSAYFLFMNPLYRFTAVLLTALLTSFPALYFSFCFFTSLPVSLTSLPAFLLLFPVFLLLFPVFLLLFPLLLPFFPLLLLFFPLLLLFFLILLLFFLLLLLLFPLFLLLFLSLFPQFPSSFQNIPGRILPFRNLLPAGRAGKRLPVLTAFSSAAAALASYPFPKYFHQLDRPFPAFPGQPAFHKSSLPHTNRGVHPPVYPCF